MHEDPFLENVIQIHVIQVLKVFERRHPHCSSYFTTPPAIFSLKEVAVPMVIYSIA